MFLRKGTPVYKQSICKLKVKGTDLERELFVYQTGAQGNYFTCTYFFRVITKSIKLYLEHRSFVS